jgi:hypothetical protein
MKITSTPNDYAAEVQDRHGNTVTVMVCKYQEGDTWMVRTATAFGGNNENVFWDTPARLTGNCFSGAVANANAHCGWIESQARQG